MIEQSQPTPSRPPWHQRAPRATLLVAALGSLIVVATLTWLLLPGIASALAAEVADGQRSFAIDADVNSNTVATVTPEAGWSVRAEGDGLLLLSPDRALAVQISPADRDAPLTGTLLTGTVLVETLASSFELRQITVGENFTGVLDVSGDPLLIEAHLDGSANLGSSSSSDTGSDSGLSPEAAFDRYRPALSALLESVRAS